MQQDICSTASLISHIHSISAEFLNKRISEQGLEELISSHGFILFCLSQTDKMTMGELAAKINRDKSTTTVLVRKLKEAGFVKIKKSESDARCKYLSLTTLGKKWNDLTSSLSHDLIKTYFKGFTEKEEQTLFSLLTRISENIEKSL